MTDEAQRLHSREELTTLRQQLAEWTSSTDTLEVPENCVVIRRRTVERLLDAAEAGLEREAPRLDPKRHAEQMERLTVAIVDTVRLYKDIEAKNLAPFLESVVEQFVAVREAPRPREDEARKDFAGRCRKCGREGSLESFVQAGRAPKDALCECGHPESVHLGSGSASTSCWKTVGPEESCTCQAFRPVASGVEREAPRPREPSDEMLSLSDREWTAAKVRFFDAGSNLTKIEAAERVIDAGDAALKFYRMRAGCDGEIEGMERPTEPNEVAIQQQTDGLMGMAEATFSPEVLHGRDRRELRICLEALVRRALGLEREAPKELGWLIELLSGSGPNHYWDGSGMYFWKSYTLEPGVAIRFARREDAVRVLKYLDAGGAELEAIEHLWSRP